MYWILTHTGETILMILVALGLFFELCVKLWTNKKFIIMDGLGEVAIIKNDDKEKKIIRSKDAK